MTDPTGRNDERTAQEVLDCLVTHLNGALRRPGMYGDEVAIRLYLDAVAFADAAEQAWQQELKDLQTNPPRILLHRRARGLPRALG
ncbi:hypothetical protein ACIPIU_11390 [Streptomyces massasporeus]|uniref:hypothetical protein n=1 Tax=Streptomyces massasporeus TaxID=67324 RepID=UPI003816E485